MDITKEWIQEIIESYNFSSHEAAKLIHQSILIEIARIHESYNQNNINRPDVENYSEKE